MIYPHGDMNNIHTEYLLILHVFSMTMLKRKQMCFFEKQRISATTMGVVYPQFAIFARKILINQRVKWETQHFRTNLRPQLLPNSHRACVSAAEVTRHVVKFSEATGEMTVTVSHQDKVLLGRWRTH